MAQVIVNIPLERMQEFLTAITPFCIANTIKNTIKQKPNYPVQLIPINYGLNTQHPYFDKDFFENYIFE
jgi:hypothetical protein